VKKKAREVLGRGDEERQRCSRIHQLRSKEGVILWEKIWTLGGKCQSGKRIERRSSRLKKDFKLVQPYDEGKRSKKDLTSREKQKRGEEKGEGVGIVEELKERKLRKGGQLLRVK